MQLQFLIDQGVAPESEIEIVKEPADIYGGLAIEFVDRRVRITCRALHRVADLKEKDQ